MRFTLPAFAVLLGLASGCSSEHSPTSVVVAPDSLAHYTVTFVSTWSAATHPDAFPSSAHFSGLIGATHDDRVSFWRSGQLASPGIQAMAELGAKSPLDAEVNTAIASGTARFLLSGDGLRPSPGQVSLDFSITVAHPLVTLVSMIAPSPDWFVGVDGFSLLRSGQWTDSLSVVLYGWDAGTDDGTTYIAPDAPAAPHVPVAALDQGPFMVSGVVPPLGRFTFVRRR